jgi:deazaflavin-dependent oxidoreductase (nitroreductase family)
MPFPRTLARINRRVTNPVQRHWAGRLPGFAILHHTGRRSGKTYSTPLNVFRTPNGFAILVDYGEQSDWLRNVLAADGAGLTYRGTEFDLTSPVLVRGDGATADLNTIGRIASKLIRTQTVLHVTAVPH